MMSILNDCWDFFFPRYCKMCGSRLFHEETDICVKCLASLPRTNLYRYHSSEVEKMFYGKFPIERATAFLYYTKGGNVRRLVYSLKYYGNKHVGIFMGRYIAQELLSAGFFDDIDALVPVPLHRKKMHKRGYNQSEALAQGISEITRLPCITDVLQRMKPSETQTHKTRYERWLNVDGVFIVSKPEQLVDKHILLVDDVITTGATIVACADAMHGISGLRISVLALAMAGNS